MLRINRAISLLLLTCMSQMVWAQQLHDPTKPLVAMTAGQDSASPVVSAFTLHSIVTSGKQRYAVINNQLYQQGDNIGDTRIKQITENSVVFTDGRKLVVFQGITSKIGTEK
ncbi:general secretion pathway protein GspB [Shewanella sp. NIFS-20-20]|uniref:general secretion pathway protein GspB n=1 Tax=Shewanella sp. NIFS-20-20 TaxID=2853806 RepID=UPI001C45FE68|nr:general secretion pathway protein GspB [Shewanella sp. NIFS-20-20]MBV7317377.1 general secretion pathway protein GspB [Shewanella sp. NIFS-20-20]